MLRKDFPDKQPCCSCCFCAAPEAKAELREIMLPFARRAITIGVLKDPYALLAGYPAGS
jgi:hypothetical protein